MTEQGVASQQELTSAFERFNELSQSLDDSYEELQQSVTHLTRQLAQERSGRITQLIEKERLAERLSLLVGALPGGVLVLDDEKNIRQANPLACQLFGQNLMTCHWPSVLQRFVDETPDVSNPYIVSMRDGRSVRVSEEPLGNTGFVVLVTDLTEVKAWQESAHKQQRLSMLGEMAARLAHQIRTPLASAMLYLSHVKMDGVTGARRQELADRIEGRLKRIESQVDGMLSFTRGGTKKARIYRIAELIEDVRQTIEPMVVAADGQLLLSGESKAAGIAWGCPDDITAAVVAVAENSLELVKPLQLNISLQVNEQWLVITVADNGPGVAPDVQTRIFDPFFTTRAKGTGLGLAMVDAIAQEHGGEASLLATDEGAAIQISIARYPDQDNGALEAV